MKNTRKNLRRVTHANGRTSYLYRALTAEGIGYGYEIADDGMSAFTGCDPVTTWTFQEALTSFRESLAYYAAHIAERAAL